MTPNRTKPHRAGPNRTKPHGSQDRWFPLRVAAPGDPSNQGYHWGIWSQKDTNGTRGLDAKMGPTPHIPLVKLRDQRYQWNPGGLLRNGIRPKGGPPQVSIEGSCAKSPPDGSRTAPGASPRLPDSPRLSDRPPSPAPPDKVYI